MQKAPTAFSKWALFVWRAVNDACVLAPTRGQVGYTKLGLTLTHWQKQPLVQASFQRWRVVKGRPRLK